MVIGQTTAYNDEFIPYVDASLYTANIVGSAYDSLLNVDNHLKFIPWLATKWQWSSDKKSLTMWLNQKAKWSDGQPITADDVLFTMDFLASPAYNNDLQGQYEYLVDPVVGSDQIVAGKATSFANTGGFKKINNFQFQITFKQVDAAVLWSSISGLQPIPKHILGKIPFKDFATTQFDKQPTVVDGAFQFSKVNGQDTVEMTANPNYWAGKPHISRLVWQTDNEDVAPGLLQSGKVDMQFGMKPTDVKKIKTLPNVNVQTMPEMGFTYLGEKLYHPEFKDVRVRQAIEYALPRNAMIKGILAGLGAPLNGPLPSVSWAAASSKDGLIQYNYDPKKAASLLDAAGWTMGSDGHRIDPVTGKTADIHLLYSAGNPTVEAEATAIRQYLGQVGVVVTLDPPQQFSAMIKKVENDDKSVWMWIAGWSLSTDPDPRGLWNSTDPFNFERWKDSTNDALIAKTWDKAAFDVTVRKQALVKWQVYVNKQLPLNFLWQPDNIYAYNKRVQIPAKDWAPTGPINYQDWSLSQ